MHLSRIRLAGAAIAATAIVALTGCSTPKSTPVDTLIGLDVPAAAELIPDGHEFVWYDLSSQVAKQGPTLTEPDGQGGVIIAVCADGNSLDASDEVSVGAIPGSLYTAEIKAAAA